MKVILILICGAVLLSAVADGETTFACDRSALSTADRKRHFDELGPEVRGMVKSVRELNDGYEFEFSSDPATVRLAAEWAAGERLCCPFFDIELRLRNKGALEMRLSGPTGVKQFIEADFGQWISGATPNAARVLDAWIGIVEKQVLACAGAMTEDGFEFAPNDFAPDKGEFHGVRTFGDQIRHIAASNYQLGAQIIGEKPPHGEHGEQAPSRYEAGPRLWSICRARLRICTRRWAASPTAR